MKSHFRTIAVLAVTGTLAAMMAGCSSGASANDGKITLSLQTFGKFGYEDLIKQYEKDHPNIKIDAQVVASSTDAENSINTKLAAGSGMPDVAAVETGFLGSEMQYPDKWLPVDDSLKDRWLSWKSKPATDKNGVLRFYGVDAGPSAICYNSSLIAAAGFPSDPAGFASWVGNSWDSFYAAGKQYSNKTGKGWFDSAASILSMKLVQVSNAYEKSDGTIIATTNPEVKNAYESALTDNKALSAKLAPFSSDWNQGVQAGSFAAVPCPSWEVGLIQAAAPSAKGWNVADAFPGGGANRGGSYLGVSTQTKHPDEAKALAAWLTAPEQEVQAFKAVGSFPSQVQALTSPDLLSATSTYASNAPVGKIFATRAQAITSVPFRGPNYNAIDNFLQAAVTRVETGTMGVEDSWKQFVSDVENNIKK